MVLLLFGIWGVFLWQPDEQRWWFWVWPAIVVWVFYQIVLAKKRCPSCNEDMALAIDDSVGPLARLLPGRILVSCRHCGYSQHGGSGWGGGPA